jgi:predicted nucleic acid-binding protein
MFLRSFQRQEFPIDASVRRETLRFIEQFGLYPGDAVHAATGFLAGVKDIVTLDFDFFALPGDFTVWQPDALIRRMSRR